MKAHHRVLTAAVGSGVLLLSGAVVMIVDFQEGGWFDIARLAMVFGGQLAVTAYFSGKRGTLDDAFEAGYQAGFHRGERVRPTVIRLPIERRQERASRLSPARD